MDIFRCDSQQRCSAENRNGDDQWSVQYRFSIKILNQIQIKDFTMVFINVNKSLKTEPICSCTLSLEAIDVVGFTMFFNVFK